MKKIDKHLEICTGMNDLYKKKNADYGDSVGKSFEDFGDMAIFIRMTDKWNRLYDMMKNQDKTLNFESMDDTIMDLANYAMIWMMERQLREERRSKKKNDGK